MHRGQLTPVSQPNTSRNASPLSFGQQPSPNRTGPTMPSYRTNDNSWTTSDTVDPGRRPGGYGGFDDRIQDNAREKVGETLTHPLKTLNTNPPDTARRPSGQKGPFPQRKDSLESWNPPEDGFGPPIHAQRSNGYGGFGATEEFDGPRQQMLSRSETYPKLSPTTPPVESLPRIPSAPGPRPDRSRSRSRAARGHDRKKSMGPDLSRRPPPRTSLMPESKTRNNGSVDLAVEFGVRNPYHTPSDSGSSGYSDVSITSRTTTHTTPLRTEGSPDDRVVGKPRDPIHNLQSSTDRLEPRRDLRIDPVAADSYRNAAGIVESPYGISPRDDGYDRSNQMYQGGSQPRSYGSSSQDRYDYLARRPHNQPRQASKDLPSVPRGDCKACGIAITGKSISSADGRLTGKYHKACFVCTTCYEPFSSSVFYVHGDKPYCEQHYHKLNGSLCGSCGRGIEGQYVEDESRSKYHVGCFACLDCGVSLFDGYFEVDGLAYCERDAWKRVQAHGHTQQESYQTGPPRAAVGARPPEVVGLPGRPGPRPGVGGKGLPQLPNAVPQKAGRPGVGVDQRMRMNKRMTRLGNMNM